MACSVFCSRVPSAIDTGFRTKNRPTTCLHPSSERSSAALWHGDHPHKYSKGIHAWRRGHISALWHGDPAYRYLGGIPAWRSILLTGLRHVDLAHKPLSDILAWREGLLSALWHGDPQQNYFWGRVTWQDCLDPVSNRSLADASAGLRHGIPGERPLGGIPAWRGSHLSALRP